MFIQLIHFWGAPFRNLKKINRTLLSLKLSTAQTFPFDLQWFKIFLGRRIEYRFIRISQNRTSVFGYTPIEISQKKIQSTLWRSVKFGQIVVKSVKEVHSSSLLIYQVVSRCSFRFWKFHFKYQLWLHLKTLLDIRLFY